MKKKLLFSAVVSILMCLCLMGGATFALFTDKAEVDVAITAGKVDVEATVTDFTTYSRDVATEVNGTFENLGTASVSGNTVTIDRMTPMDKVVIGIKLENKSNVKTKYRTSFTDVTALADGEVSLYDALTFSVDGADAFADEYDTWTDLAPAGSAGEEIKSFDLVIEFPNGTPEHDNQYQGARCDIRFTIEAVQWNGDVPVEINNEKNLLAALANGEENIQLQANIDLTNSITVANNVTIDLNGYTLSGSSNVAGASYLFKVPAGKTLTLNNGTVSFTAQNPDLTWAAGFPAYADNTISNSGKLVINDAVIENNTVPGGASYCVDCYAGSEVVVNGGKIDGNGKVAIRMFTANGNVETNVTINDGVISGSRAVWMQLAGSNTAVAPKANLTVNGGTLISTDETYKLVFYSYSYGNSFSEASVILNGGVYYGNVAFGGGTETDAHKEISIDYANCKFYGEIYSYNTNDNFTDYVAPESCAVVSNATDFVANIETADVVVLADDIDLADTKVVIPAGIDVTIDLNGNNIEGVSSTTGKNKSIFTVKGNLTVEGNGTIALSHTGDNMGWSNLLANFSVENGVLTLKEGVNVVNNGGTDMAYAVDVNTTLGESVLNVEGANLYSTYIGVRIFNNHSTQKGIVNYNAGIIEGAKNGYDIWAQLMSKPAENAVVNIATGISYTTADLSGTMYFID